MKKTVFSILLLLPIIHCFGQAVNLDNAKKRIQGTWLAQGDSICELLVTADSITTFHFRAGGVSGCSYTINASPCEKLVKFPAATGMYLVEQYKDKTLCCSISELTDISLKIIYPGGYEMTYKLEDLKKH